MQWLLLKTMVNGMVNLGFENENEESIGIVEIYMKSIAVVVYDDDEEKVIFVKDGFEKMMK